MVLKLYGSDLSTCTKRVACVLLEKKVPFEYVQVDLRNSEHKAPEFVAKQPFGQVPYIDDGGFILFESRAICRYIAEKYADQGTKLLPTGLKERALFEQAASIETSNFDSQAGPLIFEVIIKKFRKLATDEARVAALKTSLEAKLDVYEVILSKQDYLGGSELTLADLFHLPYGSMLPAAGSDAIVKRPHVAKWFDALQSRPSWQTVKDGNIKSTA